ncbi:MAG: prfB [Planctomycetaceae bacterium]|nr:prfB [Planctomycetaceae bacterium]
MEASNFWDNQEKAQTLVNELRQVTSVLKPLKELKGAVDDIQVLEEFLQADPTEANQAEVDNAKRELHQQLEVLELQSMLSGSMDKYNVYLSVQAGEGGTDASDWAAMLLRMYARWAELKGYEVEEIELSEAEEAGIRSATILIKGDNAFGYMRSEVGVHRLIRMSPFDAAGRRQTSFAAIDTTPDLDDDVNIVVVWDDDVREDVFRAGGAGGQKVNKTSSAIRLTHLPTNTVVQCQNERSQHKNRAIARKMLVSRLFQREQEKRDAEVAAKRGLKSRIGFGGETIRHYVMAPQQYVKDARTGFTVGNPTKVLDGDIDPFIESFLRDQMGKETA